LSVGGWEVDSELLAAGATAETWVVRYCRLLADDATAESWVVSYWNKYFDLIYN
jgi:hypothetical protein